MILFIILTTYILGVFSTRFINYLVCKLDKNIDPIPVTWLFSILGFIPWFGIYISIIIESRNAPKWLRWFVGKNW